MDHLKLARECGAYPWPEMGDTDSRWVFSGQQLAAFVERVSGGWMPISTAPMLGKPLLLWWRTCHDAQRGRYVADERGEGWMCDGDQVIPRNQKDCIAWMPLPPAPGAPTPAEPRRLTLEEHQVMRAAILDSAEVVHRGTLQPAAWVHEEDPSRVISNDQKQKALSDGGANASSVRPYSIAASIAPQPADAARRALAAGADAAGLPEGLIDRIRGAEQRIKDNLAPRRIPAEPTDVDLVLAEVRCFLEGKPAPFWVADFAARQQAKGGE